MAGQLLEAQAVTVAGNGSVYVAPEGTTLPVDLADLASPWADVGYIGEDGVTFTLSREQEEINAWQSADPVRVLTTSEPKTIAFELLEFDRASLMLAFRGGSWAGADPGPYVYTPPDAGANDVRALVVDGIDGDAQCRFAFPRVQLSGDVEWAFQRTDAVRLSIELSVLASQEKWALIGDLPGFGVGPLTMMAGTQRQNGTPTAGAAAPAPVGAK